MNRILKRNEKLRPGIPGLGTYQGNLLIADNSMVATLPEIPADMGDLKEQQTERDKDMKTAKHEILKLTAERDWYRQHYAELLVKGESQSAPDPVSAPEKCPVCGGELTLIKICTLPPINSFKCGNCGWNKEITLGGFAK